MNGAVALVHRVYFLVTGLWPLVSIGTESPVAADTAHSRRAAQVWWFDCREEGLILWSGNMMKGVSLRCLLASVLSLMCVLCGVGYVGCTGASHSGAYIEERTDEAVLERDFMIQYSQEVTVKGEDLQVKFASLLDDSRCPANVKCVWDGDATILISVRQANAEESQLVLHANRKFSQEGKYRQYVIRVVALDPYPRTNFKTQQSDYIATVRITKA